MDDPGGYLISIPLLFSGLINLSGVVFSIVFIILLLITSGIISASEVAFFSIKTSLLGELGESASKNKVLWLLNRPKSLLATILVLNNMVNIGVIILSDTVVHSIEFGNIPAWAHFMIEVVAVTFIIILFGEIIPKVYARKHGIKIAMFLSHPIALMLYLLKPFTWPLVRFSSLIDNKVKRKANNLSIENLSDAIEMTSGAQTDEDAHKILKGIAHFGSLDVTVIMTPRTNVVMVDYEASFEELLQTILENGYSRMPVFKGNTDNIEGIIFIKDILQHIHSDKDFAWQPLIRKPFFVPDNKKIDDLLKEFQNMKMHMAIVVDEFGGFEGIVSLEDIIEEIVGEINDEYDDEEVDYYKMNEHNYIFPGKTSLHDLLRIMEFDLDFFGEMENEVESLAGIILELSGRIPARNEIVNYKNLSFRILNADNRRINRVKVSIMPEHTDNEPSILGGILPPMALIFFISTFLFSCGGGDEDLLPRPKGYCEIAFPKKEYQLYDSICPFTFEYPVYSNIKPFTRDLSKTCWFDVVFPTYGATLHMSYEKVTGNFVKFSEDQHELAYKHISKANNIEEILVEAPKDEVWGIVYNIEGDAASPFQFHLTDSQTHFLRGSLYFDFKANADSVSPVLNFLKKDVMHMVETVKWK